MSQFSHNLPVSLNNTNTAKNLKFTQVEHACSKCRACKYHGCCPLQSFIACWLADLITQPWLACERAFLCGQFQDQSMARWMADEKGQIFSHPIDRRWHPCDMRCSLCRYTIESIILFCFAICLVKN